jgi:hypothetical protein
MSEEPQETPVGQTGDLAAIVFELEFIKSQLARLPCQDQASRPVSLRGIAAITETAVPRSQMALIKENWR